MFPENSQSPKRPMVEEDNGSVKRIKNILAGFLFFF